MSELRSKLARDGWVLLPLRLIIGFGFAFHGYAKLARGPENFAVILQAMGTPAPLFMAWITSLLECFGGAALMFGAGVLPLSVPLSVVMLVAMFGVHFQYGFSSVRLKELTNAGAVFGPVGYEINLLYIAGLMTLAMASASPLSIDRWLQSRRSQSALSTPRP